MKEDDQVKFVIGTTHHGVVLDASEIDGEIRTSNLKKLRRIVYHHFR